MPLFFKVESGTSRIAVLVICGCIGAMVLTFVRALTAKQVPWPFAISATATVVALIVTVYLTVNESVPSGRQSPAGAAAPVPSVPATLPPDTPSASPATTWSTSEPTPTPTDQSTPSPDPTASVAAVTRLSSLKPVSDGNNYAGLEIAHVGNVAYPDSPSMGCGETSKRHVEWNSAGQGHFDATLAIDDNDPQASQAKIIVEFLNHDGQPLRNHVEVTIGNPRKVSIPLDGALRLRLNCQADDRTASSRSVHAYLYLLNAQFTATDR
ncbi:hypothetical protein GA0070616_3253 [Micromonospora nigra]|uniref:NPCBM/NEW2 domain-containing protein n=1 Tax=Micromonospora nigra TaxID=145857 RepID=A0A1C6SA66_9ACTN|nr:hypothetical protein [Micromonospora nigra]SCL26172.1 hypothetical protein GA0070616_3253 [Micromonospora nigra]